uniref:Mrr1 n=1 Tax=Botryotinia fuckeliana TaxID=40559 RepID=V5QQS3_BOTFU
MNPNSPVVSTASSTNAQPPPPPPPAPAPAPASASAPKVLSCTNCRRRKIRCNKTTNPCIPCQASGTECIFPTRVRNPRPRQSNPKSRDSELLKRISHLESLVSRIDASKLLGEDGQVEDEVRSNPPSSGPRPHRSFTSPDHQYNDNHHEFGIVPGRMAHQFADFIKRQETDSIYTHDGFWTRLSEEIDGLKQLIESPSDDEDENSGSTATSPASKYDSPSQFVFDSRVTSSNVTIPYPSHDHTKVLFDIYFKNVHPMVVTMHKSTMYLFTNPNSELLDENTGRHKFKSLEASSFSMYLAAVTSMTNEECLELLNEERQILVTRYKTATEIALQESDFLNSVEIVTLQALITYIAAMRAHDRSRSIWAFIGLAVRLARGIGLHRDGTGLHRDGSKEPFDLEMRRRIWWTLIVLDTRASEDRGTETMITDGSFDTKMPANINDEDISINSKTLPVDRLGFTSMTFACITMTVSGIGLRMNFVPTRLDAPVLTTEQKEQMIKGFTDKVDSTYVTCSDPNDPRLWWFSRVSRLLSLKLWLATQYPLQRRKSTNRVLPRGQSLRTAMAFLNLAEEIWQYEPSKGWFWFFQSYVPWHAIAVALAELCAEPTGPLADQAWGSIEFHYNKWSEFVADTKDGMIWRPVKNLMKRARAARRRERGLSESQASTTPTAILNPNTYSPALDLGAEFSPIMSENNNYRQPSTIGQVDPMGQNIYGGMNFDLPMPMCSTPSDTNMASPLPIPDGYTNPHWNEFIFGLGTVGSDGPQNPEMWGSFQDYFTGS